MVWSQAYWKWLVQRFESLRLYGVYRDSAGMTRAVVRADRRLYSLTEGRTFADHFFVERIAGGCIEVTDRDVSIGRAIVRLCTATGARHDLTPATSVVSGKCVELRGGERPFPMAAPTEPLDRRVFFCPHQGAEQAEESHSPGRAT